MTMGQELFNLLIDRQVVGVPSVNSILAEIDQSDSDVLALLGDFGHRWPSHISVSHNDHPVRALMPFGQGNSNNSIIHLGRAVCLIVFFFFLI